MQIAHRWFQHTKKLREMAPSRISGGGMVKSYLQTLQTMVTDASQLQTSTEQNTNGNKCTLLANYLKYFIPFMTKISRAQPCLIKV
jgi:hypothetical protein